MPNTYLHYSEEEVDKKLRKAKGIETDKETEKEQEERTSLTPKECTRCHAINTATALYCNCGMALDIKTAIKDMEKRANADETMNKLFENEEFKKVVAQFLNKTT